MIAILKFFNILESHSNSTSFKSGGWIETMENHLEMAKTGKEFIYGITDAAEKIHPWKENERNML